MKTNQQFFKVMSKFRAGILLPALLFLMAGNAWASTSKTYYATMNVAATGSGTVYVNASGTTSQTKSTSSTSSSASISFNIYATANAGYKFSSWSGSGITFGSATTANTTGAISSNSTSSPGTSKTATASFVAIQATAAPANVNIAATDPSTTYPENTDERTLTFTTTSNNALTDFTYAPANGASGKYTFANWRRVDATHVAVDYTFAGGGNYGGLTRVHQVNVTLKGKEHATVQTCTITATFPNAKIIDGSAETIYATYKAADATQDGVEKTAVFNVENVDGTNNFDTPTFTGADASHFSFNTMSYADGKLTVKYIYNGNKETTSPTHTATLTLKVNNAIGGTDATYGSKSITVTAYNEEEATEDVSVTTAANVTTNYATFAAGLAAANASAGCTLKLLRNVDLGTITTTNNITKAMTIDLNGKTLKAAVNASSVGILTITQAVAVTIKDSKTGGKIINEVDRNSEIRTIFVNKAGATLTLESGTLAVNNLRQYASAANADLGVTAASTSCSARVIHAIAGTTVNINGGRVEAYGTRSVYGILQASSAATNKAGTSVLNISGGEIYAEGPYSTMGVYAYGKVNLSGGTITAHVTTNMVDARYAADATQNKYNGYGYGIYLHVSASATATSCYGGIMNMTGGTINVTNDREYNGNYPNYGILFNAAAANVSSATAVAADGKSRGQIASATGSIDGGEINVTSGTQNSYGVYVLGSYNSYDNTNHVVQIKNCKITSKAYVSAYGVAAWGAINSTNGACYAGDVELTNCDVYAESLTTTTAAAVWVYATSATIFKDGTTANAATWGGEFAVAGKAVINSGKYEAKTKTSSAYAVGTSSRSKTTYDAETTVAANRKRGGNAEAYPILIIHGGTFKATSTTSTARGVSNGGYCTIDGGEFEAYATTTTAHGLFCLTGKITASGVKVSASATGTAYGALADVSVPSYSSVQTGFAMAGELELNNCDITATTRTSTEARGVFVNATNKLHNWTQFKADSTSGKWAATTTYLYYKNIFPCTIEGRDSVGIAIAAKATINGCDIKATAATTTAYGVYSTATSVPASADSVASPVVNIKNTKFTVKTDGTTTAYGVYAGGPTTIDGCDFTVQPKTTTAYGVYAYDKKTTITNTKFDVKGTNTVYGLYANAAIGTTTGWDYHGEFELGEGNDMTVAATGGDASHVLTLIAAKKNVATGRFMGDYANAATAHITGGSYKATATGKTCYVLNLSANQVQGAVSAAPRCTIEGGKFWAKATGGTDGICTTNGVNGNILFKGGVYNVNTNMAAYIADGLEEVVLSSDRQEYAEGYRYEIGEMGVHGGYVCQIGSTKYRTLEEALQVVTSGQVIYMIDNYNMLTPGDYILPSGATLLIPHKDGQKTIDTHPTRIYNSYTVPTAYRKLNFAEGVHLVVNGTIQAGGKMSAKGQTDGYNGMPTEAYGWLHLEEGSSISLENGAKLYAWGYVTGKGEIDAKNGSTVYEMFQVKDWRGGTCTSNMNGNSQKVFPLNQYYIQNIECPVKFRPGSRELCDGTVNAGSDYRSFDDVKFIGERNSGSFFEMESTDVSNNTWVRKWYDAENDKQVYEANSSVYMNSISLDLYAIFTTVNFNSSNYVLPVTNNMKIHLLSGHMYIMQNTELLPGAEIEVDKLATVHINSGKSVYLFDIDEWNEFAANVHTYTLPYSPSWGTTCPRNRKITNDASINVHGTLQIDGNLYTTEGGANIFSTNEDAGTITFNVAAPTSQGSVYVANNTEPTYTERKSNSAYLKNGDGTYEHTSGTAKDKTWIYENNQWKCWTETGCYAYDAQNHPYAKPAAYEQLTSDQPDASHLHHDAATGARNFVWDENCYWWEVSATPTAEGYYLSLNADNNGKYNYYYYDSAADCWKIKTLTVTWSINGANTNYSVGYGTKPEWLGATPTKSSPSSDYALRWDGWTVSGDETVLPNDDLPVVTANTTFTAHFYEMYYQSLVTFRNDDGTVLESKLWNRGAIPSYEGTPVKEATAAQTFEFNGSWSPAITAVGSSSVEYVAQYTATTRKYTVTFVNYDMSVLGSTEVDYNTTPTTATFKAAIAPSDYEPYKPDNSAYSFEFDGWRLNGASSNGFVQVKGDQTYVAQFAETTKKYRISFVDDDGETVLHWTQLEYDAMPSYDGPATSGFDKQDAEWNYTFIGWTPATFSQVKDPQTYTANYTTSKRSYTISFDSNGGSAVSSITNEWGSAVTAPADPTRDGYTFAGWTPAVPATMPVENMECVAQWNVVTYNLTYEGLNGATNSNPATYTVETPTITLADPGVRTGYTFTGWTCGGEAITQIVLGSTGDKTITANWTLNAVTILWKSEDGLTTLETDEQVNIGDTPSFDGETPVKDATAQYTYTFDGWATEANGAKVYEINGLPAVTAAATYYAHFSNTVNNYTVSIVSSSTDYGTVDVASVATVPYGTVISTSANTINVNGTTVIATKKTDNAEYTYTFDGWTNGTAAVEGDLTVTANFTRTTNTYTVTWKNYEGTVLETDENVAYGTTPVYNGATPTKPNDGTYDYAFTGWSPEVEDVTGNATYTAQFVAVFPDLDVVSAETLSMTATNTNTTIHESGILTIPDGMTLTTTNFILKATTTTSGQLFADAANINAANAYFDLTLNAQTRTWYGVGVPWRVNAEYGIYGDGKHLVLGKDFDIIWYDGAERAAWGPVNNCYKYLEDIGNPDNRIVEPGRMYFMFFARPYNVIRFKKIAGEPLVYDPADGVFGGDDVSRFEGSTDETNWNWNGIANSYLKHVTTENAVSFAYRYKNVNMDANKTTQWELVTNFAGSKYVVGQPVMVQVPNSGTGNVWNVPASPSLAPVRKMTADGDVDRAEVLLTAHTGATDRILCVVKDDAEDKYTIGDDLVKFTTSNDVPQLWIRNYKHALAVNTIRLENNIANYPLTIVSPKAGDYKLSLVNRLATGIHLYLTFNGEAIADLTEGEYTLSLGKETSKAYGLRLVRGPRGTVTGVDEALSGKENVEKVVMDGVLYIIRQGKVYDAQGKFIRLQ